MKDQINTIREALEEAHDESLDENHFECRQILMAQITALAQLEAMVGAQEPVAYAIFAENGNIRLWATESQHVKRIAQEKGLSLVTLYAAPVAQQPQAEAVPLQVLYRSMPESCGRTNWTASLFVKGRGDFTIARSEYPHRVRYEADRVRWLIGELDTEPFILDYDADEQTPCHLCGGTGEIDGKPCWGLNFKGTVHHAAPQQAEAVPQAAEFCWLVEHFDGDGTGNSTGHYYTGKIGIADRVLTTMDANEAKRYDTWREANLASVKLGSTLTGTWRAVQHGFHTIPQQSEAVPSDVVCDKDPQGCWNVRCQLGKVCKNAAIAQQKGQP